MKKAASEGTKSLSSVVTRPIPAPGKVRPSGSSASRYGTAALDFTQEELANRLNRKFENLRIALLWENRAFGTAVGNGARARAKDLGVNLIFDEGYDQFMTDMTPLVQKLKDAK